jgi:hypothetical protein
MTKLRFLGLDVHAETIAVAIAEPGGEVRSIGAIPNRLESIRKMIGKLGPAMARTAKKWSQSGLRVHFDSPELFPPHELFGKFRDHVCGFNVTPTAPAAVAARRDCQARR